MKTWGTRRENFRRSNRGRARNGRARHEWRDDFELANGFVVPGRWSKITNTTRYMGHRPGLLGRNLELDEFNHSDAWFNGEEESFNEWLQPHLPAPMLGTHYDRLDERRKASKRFALNEKWSGR